LRIRGTARAEEDSALEQSVELMASVRDLPLPMTQGRFSVLIGAYGHATAIALRSACKWQTLGRDYVTRACVHQGRGHEFGSWRLILASTPCTGGMPLCGQCHPCFHGNGRLRQSNA
jgi:hypothetical protein